MTKKQPAKLTLVATNVCYIQIKCNDEKFVGEDVRVCSKTCIGCRTRKKTRTITFSDFPRGNRTMKCEGKVWGTKSNKTEVITLMKVCEYYVRTVSLQQYSLRASVLIKGASFWWM